ncbi:cytochrome c3 family protein, partial [Geomonas sp.]
SCVSCHNPHAGNATFFLQNYKEGADLSTFCRSCHAM